jgi:hypothetical protein
MGIMASFSKVTFKKDGAEVFSTTVTSGGCFGPNPDVDVINNGFRDLRDAIKAGKATAAARDFNSVAIAGQFGGTSREYSVGAHGATRIDAKCLKRVTP